MRPGSPRQRHRVNERGLKIPACPASIRRRAVRRRGCSGRLQTCSRSGRATRGAEASGDASATASAGRFARRRGGGVRSRAIDVLRGAPIARPLAARVARVLAERTLEIALVALLRRILVAHRVSRAAGGRARSPPCTPAGSARRPCPYPRPRSSAPEPRSLRRDRPCRPCSGPPYRRRFARRSPPLWMAL